MLLISDNAMVAERENVRNLSVPHYTELIFSSLSNI